MRRLQRPTKLRTASGSVFPRLNDLHAEATLPGTQRSTAASAPGYFAPRVQKTWKERLNQLIEAYGPVAIGTFLVLWALSVAAIVLAMSFLDWRPESAKDTSLASLSFWGKVVVGYVALKTTTIPRIIVTLAVTPLVAKVLGRSPRAPKPQP